ncbi:MAG: hypothetical protein ACMXYD_02050, partial [Candidatus Woesearchaeota archaeon]
LAVTTLITALLLVPLVIAANPGHPASQISPGTFNTGGDFTFPEGVIIQGDFLINTNTFFINATSGRVGIATVTPEFTLDVNGTARFTGAVTLAGDPSEALEAATKAYVDSRVGINETQANETYVPYEGAHSNIDLNQQNLTNWKIIEGHNSSYGIYTNSTTTIFGYIEGLT